ncbi:succinate dehydrogenase membrane anchor subunit [Acetobacter aceti NRIC 0242]|uniref:Succinate dehydrogenase hydrophobic membrane anchor subunit n=2 Tax=Acetobacter aceti TaxID=435 RepID=A0A6S6PGT6_ACEAC|nr:succinate dehydrogenase, hydrophobic membrane anchor protein [Acetobacter aceti]GBO81061.1 succinate dehydrogenase membrane anchor subunit [Acetobacter aceti NRIC 0242]TCS33178.1 succinate dehydrogenase / fumarate reductase membrane anchor subunit [Acetobacter aceti NBRC 14818]BCI68227.1 succinate dehydrogenase, hydrophobic membrane anchor protein [Acetobacter aceti]BCK75762.1 succinate dehydrogenase, hydrophobic membrane anchor protein [Acetobacter aceti NBRC 14818]GAN57941.1 succinate deh
MNATSPTHRTVMRSQLGRARGLGSGHSGTGHWIVERVSAASLLPLSGWFVIQMFRLGGADYEQVAKWGGKPVNATLLTALVATSFYHAEVGLQVIVDDYVHGKAHAPTKLLVKIGTGLLGLLGVVSVLKLALGRPASKG